MLNLKSRQGNCYLGFLKQVNFSLLTEPSKVMPCYKILDIRILTLSPMAYQILWLQGRGSEAPLEIIKGAIFGPILL